MENMPQASTMSPMPPVQSQVMPTTKKNKFLPMMVLILLVAAVFGGGLFLGQQLNNSDEDDNQDQSDRNDNNDDQNRDDDEEIDEEDTNTNDLEDDSEQNEPEEDESENNVFMFGDYQLTFDTDVLVEEVVTTDSYIETLPYETCVLRPESEDVETRDDQCTFTTYSFGAQSRSDFMIADNDRFYFGPGGTVPTRFEKTAINDLEFSITYYDDITYDNQIMMVSSCPFEDLCIFFAPEVQYLDMNTEEEYILTDVEAEDFLDLMEDLTIEEL